MGRAADRLLPIVPIALLSLVVTQIIYIVLSNNGLDINRPVIWTTEAVAFLALAVVALTRLSQNTHAGLAWAAIAVSGVLNLIQVGFGLSMFGPLSDAGEAMAPAFQAVLAGAFFLYFAGKVLFGFAAIIVGMDLLGRGGVAKVTGGLAMIAGLAAMVVNIAAMAVGMAMVFPAGATGTAATFLLAIGLIMSGRDSSRSI